MVFSGKTTELTRGKECQRERERKTKAKWAQMRSKQLKEIRRKNKGMRERKKQRRNFLTSRKPIEKADKVQNIAQLSLFHRVNAQAPLFTYTKNSVRIIASVGLVGLRSVKSTAKSPNAYAVIVFRFVGVEDLIKHWPNVIYSS